MSDADMVEGGGASAPLLYRAPTGNTRSNYVGAYTSKVKKPAYNRLKIINSNRITLRRGLSVPAAKEKKIRVKIIKINYF